MTAGDDFSGDAIANDCVVGSRNGLRETGLAVGSVGDANVGDVVRLRKGLFEPRLRLEGEWRAAVEYESVRCFRRMFGYCGTPEEMILGKAQIEGQGGV